MFVIGVIDIIPYQVFHTLWHIIHVYNIYLDILVLLHDHKPVLQNGTCNTKKEDDIV